MQPSSSRGCSARKGSADRASFRRDGGFVRGGTGSRPQPRGGKAGDRAASQYASAPLDRGFHPARRLGAGSFAAALLSTVAAPKKPTPTGVVRGDPTFAF